MIVPSYAEGNPVPRSRGPWISIRCKRRVAQVPGSVSSTTKDGCPRCLAFGHLGKHSSRQAGLRRVARSLAFGNRGYRYDASADFNSSAGYIYAPAPRLFFQRSVRPHIDFHWQRTNYRIRNGPLGCPLLRFEHG